MPRFELTRYPTDNIISRLYILGFLPPELLSEKPTEVPSNSPEERILEICSLTVACLTSNNSSICFCVNHTVSNSVLKQYVIQGYAINEKRLQALERTVDIQTKMLACTLEVEESDILKAVTSYTDALMLLDQYDHQSLKKPVGNRPIYKITYEECKKMVSHMEDSFKSDVFGVEKEKGKVEGILAAVYQSVFGGDVYPSLEEKAANLLYFMIKDHPYADGCKRIAASLFLEFLARNNALYRDDSKIISDGALVAITLMIAESRPEEKDIMVNLNHKI